MYLAEISPDQSSKFQRVLPGIHGQGAHCTSQPRSGIVGKQRHQYQTECGYQPPAAHVQNQRSITNQIRHGERDGAKNLVWKSRGIASRPGPFIVLIASTVQPMRLSPGLVASPAIHRVIPCTNTTILGRPTDKSCSLCLQGLAHGCSGCLKECPGIPQARRRTILHTPLMHLTRRI